MLQELKASGRIRSTDTTPSLPQPYLRQRKNMGGEGGTAENKPGPRSLVPVQVLVQVQVQFPVPVRLRITGSPVPRPYSLLWREGGSYTAFYEVPLNFNELSSPRREKKRRKKKKKEKLKARTPHRSSADATCTDSPTGFYQTPQRALHWREGEKKKKKASLFSVRKVSVCSETVRFFFFWEVFRRGVMTPADFVASLKPSWVFLCHTKTHIWLLFSFFALLFF